MVILFPQISSCVSFHVACVWVTVTPPGSVDLHIYTSISYRMLHYCL